MEDILFIVLAPWLVFVTLAMIACWLVKLARKRKAIALAFGVLVQMFTPDPLVEQTVKNVKVQQRQVQQKARQDGAKEPM